MLLLCGIVLQGAPAAAQPTPIEAQGDYAHPASGMIMPLTVGAFRRVGVYRYDAGALDIPWRHRPERHSTAKRHLVADC